jgi:predicted nuclease of predicted toxin-antitoxin system
MKILVDMNLSPRWAAEFQSRGIEAAHWSQIGAASAADEEVLNWCAIHAHVLFTHDLDFGDILAASGKGRPSVIQLRSENVVPEAMLQQVASTLEQLSAELAQGALVTIEPGRHRIRLLPLT